MLSLIAHNPQIARITKSQGATAIIRQATVIIAAKPSIDTITAIKPVVSSDHICLSLVTR